MDRWVGGRRAALPTLMCPFLSHPPTHPPSFQVDVYIIFAFFAAQLAYKMGEWRTIVTATVLWSGT